MKHARFSLLNVFFFSLGFYAGSLYNFRSHALALRTLFPFRLKNNFAVEHMQMRSCSINGLIIDAIMTIIIINIIVGRCSRHHDFIIQSERSLLHTSVFSSFFV